jgi:hypothetical protein
MTKNQNKVKADVAIVKVGLLEIEGLMMPDGSFRLAFSQLASLNLVPSNRSLKQLKSLVSLDFPSHQSVYTTLNSKKVNTIDLVDFELLLRKLDRMQVKEAREMVDMLVGLSIQQLFSDAFNIQFEEEQRQVYLKNRQEGKYVRRTATDALKDWLDKYRHLLSENERKFVYIHISEAVNKVVFDRSSVRLRTDWKLNKSAQVRDYMTPRELKLIEQLEDTFMRVLDQHGANLKPLQALHLASQGLYIPVQVR